MTVRNTQRKGERGGGAGEIVATATRGCATPLFDELGEKLGLVNSF